MFNLGQGRPSIIFIAKVMVSFVPQRKCNKIKYLIETVLLKNFLFFFFFARKRGRYH